MHTVDELELPFDLSFSLYIRGCIIDDISRRCWLVLNTSGFDRNLPAGTEITDDEYNRAMGKLELAHQILQLIEDTGKKTVKDL